MRGNLRGSKGWTTRYQKAFLLLLLLLLLLSYSLTLLLSYSLTLLLSYSLTLLLSYSLTLLLSYSLTLSLSHSLTLSLSHSLTLSLSHSLTLSLSLSLFCQLCFDPREGKSSLYRSRHNYFLRWSPGAHVQLLKSCLRQGERDQCRRAMNHFPVIGFTLSQKESYAPWGVKLPPHDIATQTPRLHIGVAESVQYADEEHVGSIAAVASIGLPAKGTVKDIAVGFATGAVDMHVPLYFPLETGSARFMLIPIPRSEGRHKLFRAISVNLDGFITVQIHLPPFTCVSKRTETSKAWIATHMAGTFKTSRKGLRNVLSVNLGVQRSFREYGGMLSGETQSSS